MRLKVVTQLSLGDKDGVQEFLGLGVASRRIGRDHANEVHGTLHFEGVSLFFSLYHQGGADHLRGGRDVEQKRFSIGRRVSAQKHVDMPGTQQAGRICLMEQCWRSA